ncbi:hypothetical protein [Myroides injenensis]|uniref:hypothetical protein n=1 Tax=Myroides injenensis TaxID=1183151 RepID=UPI0002888B8F|nr:hypothetical protein [Myroides injenensis]
MEVLDVALEKKCKHMIDKLLNLQERIYNYYNREFPYNLKYSPRISFSKIGGLFELNYYGDGYDEDYNTPSYKLEQEDGYSFGFSATIDFIIEHANAFIALNFNSPDAGANGFRIWNFSRLVGNNIIFKNLESFKIGLTDMGDHNLTLISDDSGQENGIIAKLVSKMPKLKVLQVPCAPNETFFEIDNLKIEELIVRSGLDHQDFIQNLARSKNLPKLTSLDFSDVYDYYSDRPFNEFTSLFDYQILFRSPVIKDKLGFHFKLRDARLTSEECRTLQNMNKIQLLHIIEIPGQYKI